MQARLLIPILFSVFILSACGTLTGIPSHGGGKRFAVEQELVAASARAAVKDKEDSLFPLFIPEIELYKYQFYSEIIIDVGIIIKISAETINFEPLGK